MHKRIVVAGGDGFCGWPAALYLSAQGHDVTIIDNLSRRRIDQRLGIQSLTPIASPDQRLSAWYEITGRRLHFEQVDLAEDFDGLRAALAEIRPDTLVHFGEQRAAPYSMKDAARKLYTVNNNIRATHNLLVALTDLALDTHLVHLGSMGVYGYSDAGIEIPEGYLNLSVQDEGSDRREIEILYPASPGSVYHMSKVMDQQMFQFYAKNDRLRITDLHQGIVWGTQTEETRLDERLINRFDYDGDYGTVLNRFLMQAASGLPLTVHGTGGQTRAFIHLQDTVFCIGLAVENPPTAGSRVKIINQMTETHRLRDLAALVASVTGARIALVDNPRKEAAENDLRVSNRTLLDLGLRPITLAEGVLGETVDIAQKYIHRALPEMVAALSTWTVEQRPGVVTADALARGRQILT
ncbi:NAD-dependent epimerase/dehydratase family protein [Pseudomonas abyssi]|uniref:NAD-dependent epimerase/dehydratase family protein n=1 Tax=Pseudomonas abyssi TaxID=170540 RepID=UPI003C79EDAC